MFYFQEIFMGAILNMVGTHSVLVMAISGFSLLFFILSLVSIPWMIKRIPVDYFITTGKPRHDNGSGPWRVVVVVVRNCFGVIFLAAGLLMLITPGQGVLTILLGLALMDFPGKRGLELKLLGIVSIRKALNFVRKKQGLPPILFQMPGMDCH